MRPMRILLASDTHGRIEHLKQVIQMSGPFDAFIFCGDGEGLERQTAELFGSDCRCYMVRGNNDFYSSLPNELVVPIGKEQAFVTHGHRLSVNYTTEYLAEKAASLGCRYAFFGHTHVPEKQLTDGVLCVNPGSISLPRQEDRKPSYALIETDADGTVHIHMAKLERGQMV